MKRISYTDQVKANLSKMEPLFSCPILVLSRRRSRLDPMAQHLGASAFTTCPSEILDCILFAVPVQLMPVEIAEEWQNEGRVNPLDFSAWATLQLPEHYGPGPCWALVPHLEGHPLRFEVTL